MAIMDPSADQELTRLWGVIEELSKQLSQNRSISVSLYGQAGHIKAQAVHAQAGFVFRRFNLDKTTEAYESELERMTSTLAVENQSLQHDNKQLNTLIKEYEQTLENLMSSFRNRARDVQEHELSLVREYEAKLLVREEEDVRQELAVTTSVSQSLAQISYLLRLYMRALGGEDTELRRTTDDEDPWTVAETGDWALERECELARLQKENEVLRRMVGQTPEVIDDRAVPLVRSISSMPLHRGKNMVMGGSPGTVGPFGTYKAMAAHSAG